MDKAYTEVFGVLGLARLEAGPALVVVTAVEQARAAGAVLVQCVLQEGRRWTMREGGV